MLSYIYIIYILYCIYYIITIHRYDLRPNYRFKLLGFVGKYS